MTPFLSWLVDNSLWSGATLLVIVILSRVFLRLPADMRCWLLRLSLLKCLIALFIPLTIAVPVLPPTEQGGPPSAALPPAEPTAPRASSLDRGIVVLPPTPPPIANERAAAFADEKPSCPPLIPGAFLATALTVLYSVGLTLFLLRLALAGLRTWRLVRSATLTIHPALAELARHFGGKPLPLLARSPHIASPLFAFGTIVLPRETDTDERLLIAHELAHWQRHDLVWEWIGAVLQTILWFHPVVHLARREERLACEQSADRLVVSVCAAAPADYARVLLAVSLRQSGRAPALSVGAVEPGSRLRRRLEALARPGLSRRRLFALGGLVLLIAALTILPWRATARQNTGTNPQTLSPAKTAKTDEPTTDGPILSGMITGDLGHPIAHARVAWVVPYNNKPSVIAETTTDASGHFVFQNAPTPANPGESMKDHWRRNLDGWVMVKAPGYGLGVKRVRFDKRRVALTLTSPHTYTLIVQDGRGRPVRGLSAWADSLEAEHTFFRLQWLGYSGKTDARGEFRAEGLPENDSVWFQTDVRRWSIIASRKDHDRTTYTVGPAHTLEGLARFPNGRPVRNVSVWVESLHGTPSYGLPSVTTDAQGHYRIDGLATGDYLLRANAGSNPGMAAPRPTEIHLPALTPTVRHDMTIVLAATVTGRVVDEQGKPFAGVLVEGGGDYIPTDQDGRFTLQVTPGSVSVSVQRRLTKQINAQRGRINAVNFTLPREKLVQLHGTVTNSRGEPVPGLQIGICSDSLMSSTTTDNQGRFSWTMGRSDSDPLTVFAFQGDEGVSAIVQPGSDAPLDLKLSAKALGHIKGQVVDSTGKPLPNARLMIYGLRLGFSDYRPPVDSGGRFSIPAVVGVPYFLTFEAPGLPMVTYPSSFDMSKRPRTAKGVILEPQETRDIGKIVLGRGKDTVTGRVLWKGRPFQNGNVGVATPSGLSGSKTDSQGRFTLKNVSRGEPCILTIYYQRNTGQVETLGNREGKVGDFGTINLP